MNWSKKGHIFSPNQKHSWNQSHAQVPVVDKVDEKVWRIFYSTRNSQNQSTTSYIEVEAGNPKNILYEHDSPILSLGQLGAFDDSGIMPSSIVTTNGLKYLYYIGWTQRVSVPYHNSIGLAVSKDNGKTFERAFNGPIITTNNTEPYFTGTCYVSKENDFWKAWYLSCTKWEMVNGKAEPFYHLKYAESKDGISWQRNGLVAIDFQSEDEGGIVSASVISENSIYKMWYGYRKSSDFRDNSKNAYRIGYAESFDGKYWERKDANAGISVSDDGWDSTMISYPNVIEHHGEKFMFYNGNGFGKTGIGFATAKTN